MENFTASLQACRAQHQSWATTLNESEQEIDHLLNLLDELPADRFRSLYDHKVDFTKSLEQLKLRIHRLQREVVCRGQFCSASTFMASVCSDTHFIARSAVNSPIATLPIECSLVKQRFQAFLGQLMGLNLI
ncbi:hypothetical protein GCM10027592_52840 [Spirosoma flavus]